MIPKLVPIPAIAQNENMTSRYPVLALLMLFTLLVNSTFTHAGQPTMPVMSCHEHALQAHDTAPGHDMSHGETCCQGGCMAVTLPGATLLSALRLVVAVPHIALTVFYLDPAHPSLLRPPIS
jgi:hypothetical protein